MSDDYLIEFPEPKWDNEPPRLARIRISQEYLFNALGFPENTRLVHVAMYAQGTLEITVEHINLPEGPKRGSYFPPLAVPIITKYIVPVSAEDAKNRVWVSFDWNIMENE